MLLQMTRLLKSGGAVAALVRPVVTAAAAVTAVVDFAVTGHLRHGTCRRRRSNAVITGFPIKMQPTAFVLLLRIYLR